MHANTDSKSLRSSRSRAVLPPCVPVRAAVPTTPYGLAQDAAPQHATNSLRTTKSAPFDCFAVFKKTPYIADLQPTGRDVAKDIDDVGSIPLLMTIQLDHDFLFGDRMTSSGRAIVEGLKSETWLPHQDVVRQTRRSLGIFGVGLKGNLAPEGAVSKVAGMSCLKFSEPAPRRLCISATGTVPAISADVLHRSHSPAGRAAAATFDVNVTDHDGMAHTSERTVGATDHLSDALCNDAQQVRSAVRGAAVGPGGAAEKHCYANV
ncbi:dihydroxy-acid dehydratase [Rhodopseudomonas sp. HC1]|uniref:dihydroxy-acid dehydratase domain-containing protein n=1 Tax=Rhodopseudomonas infernalis TaxID=2897386 RepID=UPI001EE82574|nr:dihydroxy-acid dehydratase [Rhodopseudomonas infernalis]MCG6205930.1 dihydroxy-acid dehydratase [Rhodopseudomonas infernalis]